MIHAQTDPAGGTGVAGIAVQCSATQQLRLGNVVDRLGQSALHSCRQIAAVVTGLAAGGSHYAMVHGHRRGKTDLRAVAGVALGYAGGHWNMSGGFGDRIGRSVVAGIAGTGSDGVGWRMGVLHAQPATGRPVATLAITGYRSVRSSGWLAGESVGTAEVTG